MTRINKVKMFRQSIETKNTFITLSSMFHAEKMMAMICVEKSHINFPTEKTIFPKDINEIKKDKQDKSMKSFSFPHHLLLLISINCCRYFFMQTFPYCRVYWKQFQVETIDIELY